ncbi:MAG: hypothetical protein JXJ22_07735 [Bacteroidales bacterium]|nr:hypothetical protein [Bacteroidales bacterium]
MYRKLCGTLTVLLFISFFQLFAQQTGIFKKVELKVDTSIYTTSQNLLHINNEDQICFFYNDENEVCEVTLYPNPSLQIKEINLVPSGDFEVLDSLAFFNNSYYKFKIRFKGLTQTDFLKFIFSYQSNSEKHLFELPLFPYTNTKVHYYPADNELFIGEEKVFELITTNPQNIRYSLEWTNGNDIDYRINEKNGNLMLHLLPNKLGNRNISIQLQSKKPFIDSNDSVTYNISPIIHSFIVKTSRLRFLNIDKKEITLDNLTKTEGIEVQLDNNYTLQLNKTYRIEDQEEPGGPLIAELFTKSQLTNNRVLCILRPYNFHRNSEGYLYIKDGDDAKFITNFNITPKTTISKISILHEGSDWSTNLNIYPGETIDLKIEGEGLHKALFIFEDLEDISKDTLLRGENTLQYKLKVPLDISKKKIAIYNYSEPTGQFLNIKEYQKPRDFDFIFIDYGDLARRFSGIRGPILYEKVIKDFVLTFNSKLIDQPDNLYGKQYLTIDLQVMGKNGELIEMRTINNIVVCPDDNSPRFNYYDQTNCRIEDINLNKYLRRKTYDLDEWSRILITVKHDKDKYGGSGYQKEIELVLKRNYKFDVDVSFPAGLITISKQDDGQMGFGSLSGISMAMIAQFSFYHPEKIAKYRPYKVGAGFLAFNAFNFSDDNSSRDVGIVILGSLYPTRRDVKLTFPLFVGGGYFLKDQKWFFLIGPGIRVNL